MQRGATGFRLGVGSVRLGAKLSAIDEFDQSGQLVLQKLLDATQETVLLDGFTADRTAGVYMLRFSPGAGGNDRFTRLAWESCCLRMLRPLFWTATYPTSGWRSSRR